MLCIVVYPWKGISKNAEYVAVVTDTPKAFTGAVFSIETKGFLDEKAREKARAEARKRGISFVQGLDKP